VRFGCRWARNGEGVGGSSVSLVDFCGLEWILVTFGWICGESSVSLVDFCGLEWILVTFGWICGESSVSLVDLVEPCRIAVD
jgi:hypothetical protein